MKPLALAAALALLAAGAFAQEPARVEPDDSTLLLWRFDEGDGEAAGDSSPGGRLAGTITAARRVGGRFGKALAWGLENGTVQVRGDFSAKPLRVRLPGARRDSAVHDALAGKALRLAGDTLEDTLGPREPRCYVIEQAR